LTLELGFSFLLILSVTYLSKLFLINLNIRECYVRTSSDDFDLGDENLDKIYVHLTNNAI